MKNYYYCYSFLVFLQSTTSGFSQTFNMSADIRPRMEYRHGFGNLFPDNTDPAAFVAQRSRLNFNYVTNRLEVTISVQDVSTWGDTQQILINDGNDSFSLFQAWARMQLSESWALKVGRQVISYDDQRIFGEVDWALQGRFHDGALLQYKEGTTYVDMGFAYNQEEQRQLGTPYPITGFFSYKTMQFAHIKKVWNKSAVSLLILNNGFQKFTGADLNIADGVYSRQTAGSYFEFPLSSIKFSGSAYYQFGKATPTQDLEAYQFAFEGVYQQGNILFGLGAEVLSGTSQGNTADNHSFFPLYGTNHKFNGYMDYFYVGNHANSVGLNDFYAKTIFKTGAVSSLLLKAHYFRANADLIDDADKYLGTEVDVVFTLPVVKNVVLNLGYSHMFASESMSFIKEGRSSENTNNWGWAQLIINPQIFQYKFNSD